MNGTYYEAPQSGLFSTAHLHTSCNLKAKRTVLLSPSKQAILKIVSVKNLLFNFAQILLQCKQDYYVHTL